MIIPATLIIGESGTGKSSSIKNMDKNNTVILNIEKKVLPFKEALQFNKNLMIDGAVKFDDELDKALKGEQENIVIESFHRYSDKTLELAKQLVKGYEIYNVYADRVCKMVTKLLTAENKYIYILANPEIQKIENPNGTTSSRYRCAFHGNLIEKMGGIESFFTVVLYTDARVDQQGKRNYNFLTNTNGMNTAKSPDGMFADKIPNDLSVVKAQMQKYYGISPSEPTVLK